VGLREYTIRRIITGFITLIIVLIFNWILFRLPSFVTGIDPTWFYVMSQLVGAVSGTNPELFITILLNFKTRWKIPSLKAPIGLWIDHIIAYIINMFTFNLGEDMLIYKGRPIAELLVTRIPVSVFLILPATLISILVGILIGARLGANPGSRLDVTLMGIALMLYSIPAFWLQLLFKAFFTVKWDIWPVRGGLAYFGTTFPDGLMWFLDALFMLTLPIMTLVLAGFAGWMLLMRNSLMEVMGEDYILTARAKGLDEATILYKHAFRNAILPVVTGVILSLALVWTGAVITETIFTIPGVGLLLFNAVIQLDFPLCEASFYFIAVCTIFANIIADISYALLDPRVKY